MEWFSLEYLFFSIGFDFIINFDIDIVEQQELIVWIAAFEKRTTVMWHLSKQQLQMVILLVIAAVSASAMAAAAVAAADVHHSLV